LILGVIAAAVYFCLSNNRGIAIPLLIIAFILIVCVVHGMISPTQEGHAAETETRPLDTPSPSKSETTN